MIIIWAQNPQIKGKIKKKNLALKSLKLKALNQTSSKITKKKKPRKTECL